MRRPLQLVPLAIIALPSCLLEKCKREPRPEDPTECVGTREAREPADDCADDPAEPNDDLTLATPPVPTRECTGATRSGVLAGDGDVDVFRTRDCDLGDVDPWAELRMTGDGSEEMRVCIFPVCLDGSTNVYGCEGTAPAGSNIVEGPGTAWLTHSPGSFRGCCRTGNGTVSAQLDCGTFSQKIDTYVWVDGGGVSLGDPQCRSYELAFEAE